MQYLPYKQGIKQSRRENMQTKNTIKALSKLLTGRRHFIVRSNLIGRGAKREKVTRCFTYRALSDHLAFWARLGMHFGSIRNLLLFEPLRQYIIWNGKSICYKLYSIIISPSQLTEGTPSFGKQNKHHSSRAYLMTELMHVILTTGMPMFP